MSLRTLLKVKRYLEKFTFTQRLLTTVIWYMFLALLYLTVGWKPIAVLVGIGVGLSIMAFIVGRKHQKEMQEELLRDYQAILDKKFDKEEGD